jgi:hypothetical protein
MEEALNYVDAVKGVRCVGMPTNIFSTTHTLLHIIVSNHQDYRFSHVDIASQYVGEQLWIRHSRQMIVNLNEMFGGSPSEISRHLFEIYGHAVFSVGGRTLKCRCLETKTVSEFTLDALHSPTRNTVRKDTIPTVEDLSGKYYGATYDGSFPAIDSLSSQGMFQFTVASEHPIRGVNNLQDICNRLFKEPKLYFVVPPHRFEKFAIQRFIATAGTRSVAHISELKQYVLELPIGNVSNLLSGTGLFTMT